MKMAFEYKVTLKQSNRVNTKQLSPTTHQDQILVSCSPPAKQRLLWSQSSSSTSDLAANLPRSRVVESTRTHWALVNSMHHLRLLILDKQGRASLNHESIVTNISASHTNIASLQGSNAYDRRIVKTTNQTGTVVITSESTKYNLEFMEAKVDKQRSGGFFGGSAKKAQPQLGQSLLVDQPITDRLVLEVVENVDILPRSKTIYFQGN